jgi:hypothetical protein
MGVALQPHPKRQPRATYDALQTGQVNRASNWGERERSSSTQHRACKAFGSPSGHLPASAAWCSHRQSTLQINTSSVMAREGRQPWDPLSDYPAYCSYSLPPPCSKDPASCISYRMCVPVQFRSTYSLSISLRAQKHGCTETTNLLGTDTSP